MYAPANDMNYERNLLNYAAVYADYVFREYPVSRRSRRVLRQLQHSSNLQNEDVAAIEARVFARKAYLEVAANDQDSDGLLPALRQIVVEYRCTTNQVAPPTPALQEPSASRSPVWLQASVYTAAGLLCLAVGTIALQSLQNPTITDAPPVETVPSPAVSTMPASPVELSPAPVEPSTPSVSPTLPTVEAKAIEEKALRDRCNQLRIDYAFLLRLADQGTIETANTTDSPEAAIASVQTANRLLSQLEKALDKTILPNLGHYTQEQTRQQRQRISELGQSAKTVDKEADRRFQALFPQWKQGDNIQGTGLDQVWLALVDTILKEQEASQSLGKR